MANYSTLIVEDDLGNITTIISWIQQFSAKKNIVFSPVRHRSSIKEAKEYLFGAPPDILILDYYVIGSQHEIVPSTTLIDEHRTFFKNNKIKTILISSKWEDIAARGSYPGIILAGINRDESRFMDALEFVVTCIQNEQKLLKELETITLHFKTVQGDGARFYKEVEIDIQKIVVVESQRNNTFVYKKNADDSVDKFYCLENLTTIKKMLPETQFNQVHRSFIINMNEIERKIGKRVCVKMGGNDPLEILCSDRFTE